MRSKPYFLPLLSLLLLVLAACGVATTAPAPQPTAQPAAMAEQPTEAAIAGEAIEQPTWMKLPLTDVRTGKSFTLADYAGQVVYVETMATWCPNCRTQLSNVQQSLALFGENKPVFVAISVETTLAPQDLAAYAEENGFEVIFAVATPELLQALNESFGRTITNPPSTPHFLIAANGTHSELRTGFSTPAEIVELVQASTTGA